MCILTICAKRAGYVAARGAERSQIRAVLFGRAETLAGGSLGVSSGLICLINR